MTEQNGQVKQSLANIKPMLEDYLNLRADIKDMEKELKEMDETIRPMLADRGKMQLGTFTFEVKTQPGRKTMDKAKLEAFLNQHGKSIEDFQRVGAPYTQMRVSEAVTVL